MSYENDIHHQINEVGGSLGLPASRQKISGDILARVSGKTFDELMREADTLEFPVVDPLDKTE